MKKNIWATIRQLEKRLSSLGYQHYKLEHPDSEQTPSEFDKARKKEHEEYEKRHPQAASKPKLVIDVSEDLDTPGEYGWEMRWWSESGGSEDTVIDSKYGFPSHDAAESAGNKALKKYKNVKYEG